jgi:squalene-hopene/tetraprenyl-beta-curcumene cyclase
MQISRRPILVLCFALAACGSVTAADRPRLDTVTAPPPIAADEPLLGAFSLERAVLHLDQAALHWQKERQCGTCHTNFAHLMARPLLAGVVPPPPEVRKFFEDMVEFSWQKEGPRWDAEVVCAATTLAWNDRATGGKLHPLTRKALDRACGLQRADGGWDWLKCGWPPMESDDHYGVTFAAIGIGCAPEGYARSEKGARALEGARRYLKENAPPSLHHRAMLLWASRHAEGILAEADAKLVLDALFARQLPDGGWAVAGLIEGWKGHTRQDDQPQDLKTSDGYATGFVTFVARQAGVPADDPRLERAVKWLETHQRASGRWFTRSPTRDSRHFLSNAGTAYALLALEACGKARSPAPAGER